MREFVLVRFFYLFSAGAACSLKAGMTCSMNSSSERFFSSWLRVLSAQKLYSVTPSSS